MRSSESSAPFLDHCRVFWRRVKGFIGLRFLGAALGIILFFIGIIDLLIGIGSLKGWGWI